MTSPVYSPLVVAIKLPEWARAIGTWWVRDHRMGMAVGLDDDVLVVDEYAIMVSDPPTFVATVACWMLVERRWAMALAEWARSIAEEIGIP